MTDPVSVSHTYALSDTVDLVATLETMSVQYLDVDEQRTLVIFTGAILNLESDNGSLTDLTCVEITVYNLPLNSNRDKGKEDETAATLITDFVDRLGTTAETDYERIDPNGSTDTAN
ncbi:hypothetical protein HYG81_20930 (plasmid) [Natrinema zhouii]|uniref:hypothetical protein n=1 Tax=Natrinema zhouii TaxID=1710539 RepID=UPI001CFFAA9B|nr:hypothetical protein [Natrinema zhouii]UHQ98075.1 hypothetical protein HYG81_20930 [Natrinema zhouii]